MRQLFVLLLIAGISFHLGAQRRLLNSTNVIPDLCILPAPEPGNVKRVSKPYRFSGNDRSLNYTITYVANGDTVSGKLCKTFPNNAKTALEYAASIWSDVLNSDPNLGILACWTDSLGANTLGSAGPNNFYALSDPGAGLDAAYFPSALTEYLVNGNILNTDIVSFFNAQRNDWYFGTDANPTLNTIDFVSVALHELGHGLGFIGSARVDSVNQGYIGYNYPFMYDVFVDNNVGNPILDLPSPSPAIYSLLTGGNNSLRFDDTNHSYFRVLHFIRLLFSMQVPPILTFQKHYLVMNSCPPRSVTRRQSIK